MLPGRAVRRAATQIRRRVGVPRRGVVRAGDQPSRPGSADAAPAPDRPGRPAARLPGQGGRRTRHAASAARHLPPRALRGRGAAALAGCGNALMEYTHALRPPRAIVAGRLLGAGAALAAFAAALSLFLSRHPPSALIIVAFAIVILGALWLAITHYDVALALAVGAITSRFRLRRVIPGAVLLVGAYLALNLIAAVGAADPQRAVSFLAITFYVACFGLWLAAYVASSAIARRITRCYVAAAVASALG